MIFVAQDLPSRWDLYRDRYQDFYRTGISIAGSAIAFIIHSLDLLRVRVAIRRSLLPLSGAGTGVLSQD